MLKIENRQLRTWERQQLIPLLDEYSFADLLALKRIARLRAENAHPRRIRLALEALRGYLKESREPRNRTGSDHLEGSLDPLHFGTENIRVKLK